MQPAQDEDHCKASRFFTLTLIALEPTVGASAHGAYPSPGRRAPMCSPPRKSFKIVATQQGEKNALALKKSTVRVCFIIRSWGKGTAIGLAARCFTLRAAH
jgi:hypothetical protein